MNMDRINDFDRYRLRDASAPWSMPGYPADLDTERYIALGRRLQAQAMGDGLLTLGRGLRRAWQRLYAALPAGGRDPLAADIDCQSGRPC